MSSIVIKADALARTLGNALPFAANPKEGMPMLSAVRIEARDGVFTATATDRYVLGHARCTAEESTEPEEYGTLPAVSIPVDGVKRIIAALRGQRDYYVCFGHVAAEDDDEAGEVTLHGDMGKLTVPTEPGEFPRFVSLFPAEYRVELAGEAGYNPAFMARFGKVKADKGTPMRIVHAVSPTKPIVIEIGDAFVGLIMPVRAPEGETRHVPVGFPATEAEAA